MISSRWATVSEVGTRNSKCSPDIRATSRTKDRKSPAQSSGIRIVRSGQSAHCLRSASLMDGQQNGEWHGQPRAHSSASLTTVPKAFKAFIANQKESRIISPSTSMPALEESLFSSDIRRSVSHPHCNAAPHLTASPAAAATLPQRISQTPCLQLSRSFCMAWPTGEV